MLVDPVEGCGVISMDITTRPWGMDQDGGHPILKNLKKYKKIYKLTTFSVLVRRKKTLAPWLQLSPMLSC